MKVLVALAGVLVVLLAFGVFTAMKMARRSLSLAPTLGNAPAAGSAAALPAVAERSKQAPAPAITVALDAGRAHP